MHKTEKSETNNEETNPAIDDSDSNTESVKELFLRAVEIPEAGRGEFLADVCSGDDVLREKVGRLLKAHLKAGTFLADPDFEPGDDTEHDPDIVVDDDGVRWIGCVSAGEGDRAGWFRYGVPRRAGATGET